MNFAIQTGNVSFKEGNKNFDTVGDALEDRTSLNQEYLILFWNHISIPITYKYDLSVIIYDIFEMIESVLNAECGEREIVWASNTFNAKWILKWTPDELSVASQWFSVIGGMEAVLNERGEISMKPLDFLKEWKMVLLAADKILAGCSGSESFFSEHGKIRKMISRIEGVGQLYSEIG